ncbi:hypothetical protein M6B38_131655 [Iris pallida]|uniref:Uncharacterized protein n=1 Tax=Iris pallida TaxID=29817 RepID=A0AAX6FQY2_IRIPA|nr:hypothetical protein M6B38_131655 [Iris pallida]
MLDKFSSFTCNLQPCYASTLMLVGTLFRLVFFVEMTEMEASNVCIGQYRVGTCQTVFLSTVSDRYWPTLQTKHVIYIFLLT